jgi:hypothetical protein
VGPKLVIERQDGGFSLKMSFSASPSGVIGGTVGGIGTTPPPETDATEASSAVIEEATGLAATFLVDGRKDMPYDRESHRFGMLSQNVIPQSGSFTTPRLMPRPF